MAFEATAEKTHRTFLTAGELNSIEKKTFEIDRLEKVKDIFIFSCYTVWLMSMLKNLPLVMW